MKRFLCKGLILALLCAMCLPAALAEDVPEAVSEAVEAEVAEATETGDTGLTVEGAPAPVEEAPAPEAETAQDAPMAAVTDEVPADEGEQAVAAPEVAAATGIQLSAAAVNLGVKEKLTLGVTALPAGSAVPAVTWRSDNEKIVRVDAGGTLLGVKRGTANVYAQMAGGAEVPCAVTVMKAPGKLAMNPKKLTLGSDGMTTQLTFSVPKGCFSNSFTWASSNPGVAVVDANGLVTTVGPGKCTIAVKAYNGKGGKCSVTVLGSPTAIAFPVQSLSMAVGQNLKLSPSVTFSAKKNADPGITYAIGADSRDAGCVSLNPATGEVSGVRKGSCVITATTYNGKVATLPVTVAAAPTDISLNQESVSIGVKDVYSGLLANLSVPAGETEVASTVVWTTSNKKVATVDANGIVTGVRKGSCVITATTANGLKDACKVSVFKAPRKLSLNPAKAVLNVGETGQYQVVFPRGTGGTVRFDTSDHAIATIDDFGVVTAVAEGTVTVTATCYNGRTAKGTLQIGSAANQVDLPATEYSSIISTTSQYSDNMTNAQKLEYVIYVAQSQAGKPYIYGSGYKGGTPSGFDCSGLVYWCFQHIGVKMKDTAYKQGYDSSQTKISSVSQLKRGDIVCFNTVADGSDDLCDHTGIYLGNGYFIHASSSAKKVVTSTLASGYYSRTFSWGRRVLG